MRNLLSKLSLMALSAALLIVMPDSSSGESPSSLEPVPLVPGGELELKYSLLQDLVTEGGNIVRTGEGSGLIPFVSPKPGQSLLAKGTMNSSEYSRIYTPIGIGTVDTRGDCQVVLKIYGYKNAIGFDIIGDNGGNRTTTSCDSSGCRVFHDNVCPVLHQAYDRPFKLPKRVGASDTQTLKRVGSRMTWTVTLRRLW